ncbi:MAG: protease modulator HflC [Alphaproteobacteria bacterium]|nr:protease modulator HflC [Alphaproteobacteria bacterium]
MKPWLKLALGIVIVVLGIATFMSLYTVNMREQALIIQFGEPIDVVEEPGLHFKWPWRSVTFFDKRVLDYDARTVEVPTRDQKQLVVDAFSRYRIVNPLKYFQSVRTESDAHARLGNFMEAALRQTLGRVGMLRILTEERAALMDEIGDTVNRQAQALGINVIDVRIKRVDLPEANSQAIFRRMQTQREQEARRIRAEGNRDARQITAEADKQERVIIAEAKKQAEILRGEGDAEAERIYIDAYGQDEKFFDFWRSMQAMSKGLADDTTSYIGSPDGDFFRFFGDQTGTGLSRSPRANDGAQSSDRAPTPE